MVDCQDVKRHSYVLNAQTLSETSSETYCQYCQMLVNTSTSVGVTWICYWMLWPWESRSLLRFTDRTHHPQTGHLRPWRPASVRSSRVSGPTDHSSGNRGECNSRIGAQPGIDCSICP